MNIKQIITIIILVFSLMVGYKIISSNIQENKEKAILQEKVRLEELSKKPLNDCLKIAYNNSMYSEESLDILAIQHKIFLMAVEKCPSYDVDCVIDSTYDTEKTTLQERRERFDLLLKRFENDEIRYKEAKEDCYKRYK